MQLINLNLSTTYLHMAGVRRVRSSRISSYRPGRGTFWQGEDVKEEESPQSEKKDQLEEEEDPWLDILDWLKVFPVPV